MMIHHATTATVERVSSIERWKQVSQDFDYIAAGNFMQQTDWLLPWWLTYGTSKYQLSILRVELAGQTIGFLPLFLGQFPLGGAKLSILGGGKACSDNVGLQALPGYEFVCANAIVDYLIQPTVLATWDFVELDGVRSNSVAQQAMFEAYSNATGNDTQQMKGQSTWEIGVQDGWEGFLATHSKRTRRLFRKTYEDGIDSGTAKFEIASTSDDIACFMAQIAVAHQARWKAKGIAGCFDSDGFPKFLSAAATNLWRSNRLYCARVMFNGEFAAGVLGCESGERLSLYLVGMNDTFAEHRPGLLLNLATLRYAIDNKITVVDFLRGDEEYKARLGATPVEQLTWRAAAPHTMAQFRERAWQAGAKIKHWVKDSIAAHMSHSEPT